HRLCQIGMAPKAMTRPPESAGWAGQNATTLRYYTTELEKSGGLPERHARPILGLLQVGADVGHHGAELGADRRERGDGGDGDQRGDQAILDGGGAGLVLDELANDRKHGIGSYLRVKKYLVLS